MRTEIDNPITQPLEQVFPILVFFAFGHLPPHLRAVSEPFHAQAVRMASDAKDTPASRAETAAGLRKLLEAKDCAVRAVL